MKKLLTLLMLTFLTFLNVGYADIGPVGRSAQEDNAQVLMPGSLEKWFIYVRNQSGGALENGDVVIADVANDDGYSVTTTTTAGEVPLCILAEACADDAICKCQTYGLHTAVNFDSTNSASTAGNQVFLSESTAGKVEAEALGSIAASDYPIGIFYDTSAASADVEVFIRLR